MLADRRWSVPDLWLASVPAAVYCFAYAFLAYYHGRPWLWDTAIHEGGTLKLWETILYASHFLGHLPVHVVAALLFVGFWKCCCPRPVTPGETSKKVARYALAGLLLGSAIFSLAWFGVEETLTYLGQRRQGVATLEQGGSWNLHLPSTILLFLEIPLFVAATRWVWQRELRFGSAGWKWIIAAAALTVGMTVAVNLSDLKVPFEIMADPRYQAHSVRELATFPLTYFPLLAFLWIRWEPRVSGFPTQLAMLGVLALGLAFVSGVSLQAVEPLSIGIGELASRPSFAKAGELGIVYLLAQHYFEHVLDSIFFALLGTLLAVRAFGKTPKSPVRAGRQARYHLEGR